MLSIFSSKDLPEGPFQRPPRFQPLSEEGYNWRKKQIDLIKKKEHYKYYETVIETFSDHGKLRFTPPELTLVCSKRSWQGRMNSWQRELHLLYYDARKKTRIDMYTDIRLDEPEKYPFMPVTFFICNPSVPSTVSPSSTARHNFGMV